MNKKGILIGAPLDYGGGGFVRYHNILPYLAKYFKNNDISLVLLPTCNSLAAVLKSLVLSGHSLEKAYSIVADDMLRIAKKSAVQTYIIEPVLNYSYEILRKELRYNDLLKKKVLGFTLIDMYYRSIIETNCMNSYMNLINDLNGSTIFAYSFLESYDHILTLRRIGRELKSSKNAVMLQVEPYEPIRTISPKAIIKSFESFYRYKRTLSLYDEMMKYYKLKLLLSVSSEPILVSGIDELANRYGCNITIPRPANAFDSGMLRFRSTRGKGPTAVFFARLIPTKGLYEIPYIWKCVNKLNPNAELKVIGAFGDVRHQHTFFDLIAKLNVKNIRYLGYLTREKMWQEISEAKVLVYPSHQDAFPLTVLESLALGLTIVAYEIPAIISAFTNLPPLLKVHEGDVQMMAEQVSVVLNMSDDLLQRQHEDEKTKNFLNLHSSWENVAKAEYNLLTSLWVKD